MSLRKIIIVLIILTIILFVMFFAHIRSNFVRQMQGPIEGTDKIFSIGDNLFIVSKNNNIFNWQWNDLSKWPVLIKPDTEIIVPVAEDKMIYVPSSGYNGLVLSKFNPQKEIARQDIPFGAEIKKIKTSSNNKFGAVTVLFNEGAQKNWLKAALFKTDLKYMSFIFQKDTIAENFSLDDFDISDNGSLFTGAGKKGSQAWIFVTDSNGSPIWEKTFPEYSEFTCITFSPGGKAIFAAEKVRHILGFDAATGEIIKRFEMSEYPTPSHQKQNIAWIVISSDGRILASDTEPGKTVWFWDLKTDKKIGQMTVNEFTVSGVAFSPDSKYLATGCLVSPEIKIWKVPQISK